MLRPEQIQNFRQRLRDRADTLRREIRDELLRSDDKDYRALAGLVLDTGEQAAADVYADVSIAGLRQEVSALADVMAAEQRIAEGTYGVCPDCGDEIDVRRLDAYPTAKRCTVCQARHENVARDRTPSL